MKSSLFLAAVAFCAAMLVPAAVAQAKPAAPSTAAPAASGPSKIAFINIQDAIVGTAEGKKLNDALQARFQPKRTELENDQKEITNLQNQLNNGGNTMSQQAKDDLTREIASKQRDFQQSAENANSDYQNAQTDLMNTVGNKMMPIIKSYAEQHGYTAVIDVSLTWPQNPLLYHSPGSEITEQIVKLYDAAHPSAESAGSTGSSATPASGAAH